MIYKLKKNLELFEGFIAQAYQTIISIIKVMVISNFNIKLPQVDNSECLVLGNGPSLKATLEKREFMKDKEMFCVNMFPLTTEYEELKPGNLLWLDNQFFIHRDKHTLATMRPDIAMLVNRLIDKTTWPLRLYLPVLAKKSTYLKEIPRKNSNIKIIYFNYTIVKGFSFFERIIYAKNLGMPPCENVLAACIFLALNRGFKVIYLCGADHSWMKDIRVNQKNELMFKDKHFYSGKPDSTRKLPNEINMVRFCRSQMKAFQSYFLVRSYADFRKVKVYNISEESFVDAFDRLTIS